MNNFENYNNNIFSIIKKIKMYILFSILLICTLVFACIYYFYKLNLEALNNVRIIDLNGNIYNSKFEKYDKNSTYHYRAFIALAIDNLFSYNYKDFKSRNELAAKLGDQSLEIFISNNFDNFQKVLNLKGFSEYNRLKSLGSLNLLGNTFKVEIEQTITLDNANTIYNRFFLTGEIYYSGDINEYNPYGLYIKKLK